MAALDRSALRIAGLYALFGIAWIVLSDDLLLSVSPDIEVLARLGMWKGLAFVLVTACVIYLVVNRRWPRPEVADARHGDSRGFWPLTLIFILLASIIVAVGLLGVAYNVTNQKAAMYERLQSIADLKIGQIRLWLDERRGDAEMVGSATVLREAYGEPGKTVDAAGLRRIADRLETYNRAYGYRAVLLVDSGGAVRLAAGDSASAVNRALRDTIRRALDTGQTLFTDLYRLEGSSDGPVVMDCVAPVKVAAGRWLAVVLRIDARRFLFPLIQSWPAPSASAETLLFRADEDRVLFLNDLRHRPDTALKLHIPFGDRDVLAVQALTGRVKAGGVLEGIDYRRVPVIGVAKAVPGTPWYMLAKVDKEELYAQSTREAGWIILADTLFLIVAAVASVLVHQRREMRLTLARQREQEEKLRSLRLLDAIAEGSSDAIFVKDAASNYVFINRAHALALDRTREEVLGHDDGAFFPPEVARRLRDKDLEVMAGGQVQSYEATYPLPGGERTFLLLKGPLRGAGGQVTGIFGIARDITERKRAEDAIHASERRFRSLFDNMLNGFAYCRMIYAEGEPVDFVYLEVNPAFGRLTGLTDVVGKRVTEAIPGIRESNPELFEIYGRVAATAVPEKFETFVAPLNSWFLITVYSPEPGYFVAIFDIVTDRKRAEAALIESEHRFATVFRASPVGIALCDLDDGGFLDVNDTFLAMFGRQWADVVGHCARELELWADPGAQDRLVAALGDGGQARNLELKFRHRDGTVGDALVAAESIELNARRYMLAMIADISDLRAAEREARQRDAVLDSVFQTLPDLFFLMDRDGTIRDYRARAGSDLYAPPEAFLGKRMQDVLPPELGEQFVQNMEAVRSQGGLAGFEYDLDVPGQGPRRYEARLVMPEGDGQFVAVVRDITQLHLDRQALAESEQRFVRALENIPDVVVIYDRDLRIRFINGATLRLTGRPVSDFLGRREEEIWPPEVYDAYLPALEQALATGEVRTLETELSLPTGTRSLHIACIPLLDARGEVYGVMGVTHDLTEQKRVEKEILQFNAELEERVRERTAQVLAANKELETFAYSVSHDLKAPLRGIDGYSRLLIEDCASALSVDCRQFVRNIRNGTEQMRRLIDDLLAYSRMERRALMDGPVAVADIVRLTLAERSEEILERGVEVHVDLPATPVRADPDGLLFVLRNLVDNALKFSRDARPPVIEIGGRIEGEGQAAHQVLWIKDNGIGFDMKFHDRIFEIFQRLQRAEDYPGTGVGLAIVHKAMARMKGRVRAESEPGRGATFYLELPA